MFKETGLGLVSSMGSTNLSAVGSFQTMISSEDLKLGVSFRPIIQ